MSDWDVPTILEALGYDPAECADPETEYDARIAELRATTWAHQGPAPVVRDELWRLGQLRHCTLLKRRRLVFAAMEALRLHRGVCTAASKATGYAWALELGLI